MSQEERLQILQMVHDGVISVDDAHKLLAAINDADDEAIDSAPIPVPPTRKAKRKRRYSDAPPDMQRFRRYWEYPFMVGLILLGVAGLCASNTPSPLIAFCGWTVFVLAGLVALIGWFSQWSPWMHVRVHESDGSRIAFSLPLPLSLIGVVTDIASVFVNRFADKKTAENLGLVTSLITMLSGETLDEPITIEVDEDDGDHVQVFLG